jgi:hypothetical protein
MNGLATPQLHVSSLKVSGNTPGPLKVGLSDSDSAVSVEMAGTPGLVDQVVPNVALDAISVRPAVGVRTVSLWAGSSSSGGRVMFGAVGATTTAGDVELAAGANSALVTNRSPGTKQLRVSAVGSGLLGRLSGPIDIPAGVSVKLTVSNATNVPAAQLFTTQPGGSPVALATSPYGVLGLSIRQLPATVKSGTAVRVRVSSAIPVSPDRVALQTSSDGRTWRTAGTFYGPDSQGCLYRSATLTRLTYLRARFTHPAHVTAYSGSKRVAVQPIVGSPHAPSRASHSKYYTVYGYLKPRHASGTFPVRIYKWKKTSSGKWKKYGYVKAKARNYKSYTKYSRKIRLPYKGKWRLRAYAPADSKHPKTWSSKHDYVTVK